MNLDPDQRRAVEHLGGPLLVLAGPGTGKTGVLISRVAHLVEERKVEPRRILALTFSRRAAEEMQSRILARSPEAADVEVRTFHSFALRLVRRHHRRLGFERPPDILPTARQWATIKDLLKDEDPIEWDLAPNAFDRSATVREVYDLMLRAQEHLKGPKELREFGERHDRPYLSRAGDLLERYRHRLREDSEVDYERVVQLAIELLRSLALAGSRESGVG
ncbi:MAG: UvrD-helicase domain-containing protein, partial [Rubrobacteraceae bacterium]